jgi:hypothetical protein
VQNLNDVFKRLLDNRQEKAEGLPGVEMAYDELAVKVNESLVIDCSREYCPVSMQRPSKEIN